MVPTRPVVLVVAALLLLFALLATSASAQPPTVSVSSPLLDAVVAGDVTFQGTASDPDGNLKEVQVSIEGVGVPLKPKIAGGSWTIDWKSTALADARRTISVVALDKAGETSTPVTFTIIVDNTKKPTVTGVTVLADPEGDGTYAKLKDLKKVPTTRVSFELQGSEPLDENSLRNSVAFSGGASDWQLAHGGGAKYWINVSYLAANTSYTFSAGAATDLAGNPVATYELPFKTVAEPTPGTPEGPSSGGITLSFDSIGMWGGVAAAAGVGIFAIWAIRRSARRGERGRDRSRSEDED